MRRTGAAAVAGGSPVSQPAGRHVTGNTHRAEFCIDKLYSPDSATGRLGMLEFRGFEMPPHNARMALVQALLLRCLVARFWRTPYHKPLIRWGTELHDRFMLPHYIWQDFNDVLSELGDEAGYDFAPEWFAPHFGIPLSPARRSGAARDRTRTAARARAVARAGRGDRAAGGTVRYVDSSVERLQVKVAGLNDQRHVMACNGWKLPLRATGTAR
jgi:uncharacterized protein (DUF2126 family)